MRSKTVTAACGLALAVAAAAPAAAASLEGQAFAIDKTTASQAVYPSTFATGGANFGVSFAGDTNSDGGADTVWLQLFKAKGKPDGKKAEVAKGKPGMTGVVSTFPSGGLALSGGGALVSYFDLRFTPPLASGGLFGQEMKGGKKVGKEVEIDAVKTDQVSVGALVPLKQGGLAWWTSINFQTREQTGAGRFVSADGKLDKAVIDFSRPKSQFSGAFPFLDGFIAQWVEMDKSFKKGRVFARIYDGKGKPTGPEQALTETGPLEEVVFTSAIGLAGGEIAVVTSARKTGGGAKLTAQLYDKSWKTVGKEKTLVKEMLDQPYAAHPLTDGGLLVGAKVADGAKDQALALTTFNATLKAVGPTARIAGVAKPDFAQMLALEDGSAVVLYTSDGKSLTGQLIKP
ncbi:hypothetical protein [Hansschlegelia zhihuaiae]|uniref:DUF3616 domain-containing protein n=1 Tax=Hansschlegelia zhihuaiae TaxID=405005 RepID=A0A4Q0MJA7_9HYPH|nr:hypothetical protein [Hansschlegelia zhihuaiae]RXF73036.1 hypothetical protein EK403_12960 [Hansschlegelia zhihuaiae]